MEHPIVFSIFLIFFGAAVCATLALYARQSVLVAYILLGALIGPYGFGWINDATLVKEFSHVGIIFLLFLLGLNMAPNKLLQMLRQATVVTLLSSLAFGALAAGMVAMLGYSWVDSLVIGAALMFSSTIIGLKLLPTTTLHHRRTGEIVVSVLLLQDVIAILIMLALRATAQGTWGVLAVLELILVLPAFFAACMLLARYGLHHLFARFDKIHEYLFLVTIGWCLGAAQAASYIGLSHEIGAFVGGVAVATSPIARFIAESLKPLRDFFLVMFFFGMGAAFDAQMLPDILGAAVLLAGTLMLLKPYIFERLLRFVAESPRMGREIGVRLGQVGEFSFLIAFLALDLTLITPHASSLIQVTTLFTLVASSYWIVLRYPTPLAISDKLRRD
jgi:Kef-type K+ transport system membrane component KefB